jgi:hypothetical protein
LASLLLHTGVRLVMSSDDVVSREAISDLVESAKVLCYLQFHLHPALTTGGALEGDSTKDKKKKKRKGAALELPTVEEKQRAMNVFVDVLLSLLASPSRLLREAAKAAFRVFVPDCTAASIDALMKVTLPSRHAGEDGDSDDGESGSDDDDDSGSSGSGDDGELGAAIDVEHGESSDDETADGDAETVKMNGNGGGAGDGDDDDDEEMVEMKEYDRKLVEMLRMRKAAKVNARAVAQEAMHFRYRVLDLVDVALAKLESHPLLFNVVIPLLKCAAMCTKRVKQGKGEVYGGLLARVLGLLNRVAKLRVAHVRSAGGAGDAADEPQLATEDVLTWLRAVLKSAERVQGKDYGTACVAVSWALLRSLRLGGDGPSVHEPSVAVAVADMYGAVASRYLRVKNSSLSSQVGEPAPLLHICVLPFPCAHWLCVCLRVRVCLRTCVCVSGARGVCSAIAARSRAHGADAVRRNVWWY